MPRSTRSATARALARPFHVRGARRGRPWRGGLHSARRREEARRRRRSRRSPGGSSWRRSSASRSRCRLLVELALWVADYYGSTPGRALALIAPAVMRGEGCAAAMADRDSLPGGRSRRASRRRKAVRSRACARRAPAAAALYGFDRKREDGGLPAGRRRGHSGARARRGRARPGDRPRTADRRPIPCASGTRWRSSTRR